MKSNADEMDLSSDEERLIIDNSGQGFSGFEHRLLGNKAFVQFAKMDGAAKIYKAANLQPQVVNLLEFFPNLFF